MKKNQTALEESKGWILNKEITLDSYWLQEKLEEVKQCALDIQTVAVVLQQVTQAHSESKEYE